jgi:hypothetical protein
MASWPFARFVFASLRANSPSDALFVSFFRLAAVFLVSAVVRACFAFASARPAAGGQIR